MSEEKTPMTVGDLLNKMPKFKKPNGFKTHIASMIMSIPPWGNIWPHLLFVQIIGLMIMIANIIIHKGDIFNNN